MVSRGGARFLSFNRRDVGKALSLPCGRCVGCRLERARQIAVRCVHEARMHEENCFITLTYDKTKIPSGFCHCRPEHVSGSVCLDDCQLFLKRLRARVAPVRIRYLLGAEYGERYGRPHYHGIIFGWRPSDGRKIKGEGERTLYSSALLSEVWGKGFASFGSVSFESASYVANYAQKKVVGQLPDGRTALEYYEGRRPEFLLMSRRPGLGRSWFDRFGSDVYPRDEVIVNGRQTRPPRYYDKLGLIKCRQSTADILARREVSASRAEEFVDASGVRSMIAPSRNARRLLVRETVARAKLAQKVRRLGD